MVGDHVVDASGGGAHCSTDIQLIMSWATPRFLSIAAATTVAVVAVFLSHAPPSQQVLDQYYAGRRVLLTGASYGIGAEIAKELASHGAALTIVARSKDKLDTVATKCRELGAASCQVLAADLSLRNSSRAVVEDAGADGGIDLLILNHIRGDYNVWTDKLLHETEHALDVVDSMYAINTLSYIYLSTFALPFLQQSKNSDPRMLAIGSLAGTMAMPRVAPYASTKFAVLGYFNDLRQDLRGDPTLRHISVSTAILGSFDTEGAKDNVALLRERGIVFEDPNLAAKDIVKGLAMRRNTIYTPWSTTWTAHTLHGVFPALMECIASYVATGMC